MSVLEGVSRLVDRQEMSHMCEIRGPSRGVVNRTGEDDSGLPGLLLQVPGRVKGTFGDPRGRIKPLLVRREVYLRPGRSTLPGRVKGTFGAPGIGKKR